MREDTRRDSDLARGGGATQAISAPALARVGGFHAVGLSAPLRPHPACSRGGNPSEVVRRHVLDNHTNKPS